MAKPWLLGFIEHMSSGNENPGSIATYAGIAIDDVFEPSEESTD